MFDYRFNTIYELTCDNQLFPHLLNKYGSIVLEEIKI